MKLRLNIAVKNVLQVYVTKTLIFFVISSQKVRTPDTLRGTGSSRITGHVFLILLGTSSPLALHL